MESAPNIVCGVSTTVKRRKKLTGRHIGRRVDIKGYGFGTLRFVGQRNHGDPISRSKNIRYGIELDMPLGLNDGSVQGVRYFDCDPGFGVMVGQKKVTLLPLTTKESSRHSASRMHPSFIVLEPSARRRGGSESSFDMVPEADAAVTSQLQLDSRSMAADNPDADASLADIDDVCQASLPTLTMINQPGPSASAGCSSGCGGTEGCHGLVDRCQSRSLKLGTEDDEPVAFDPCTNSGHGADADSQSLTSLLNEYCYLNEDDEGCNRVLKRDVEDEIEDYSIATVLPLQTEGVGSFTRIATGECWSTFDPKTTTLYHTRRLSSGSGTTGEYLDVMTATPHGVVSRVDQVGVGDPGPKPFHSFRTASVSDLRGAMADAMETNVRCGDSKLVKWNENLTTMQNATKKLTLNCDHERSVITADSFIEIEANGAQCDESFSAPLLG